MEKNAVLTPNPLTPCVPITFDAEKCVGCNRCVEVCRTDVLAPNPEKGKPPIVVYPDECWFCGCCVEDCAIEGACRFQHPLNQKIAWMRKDSGEIYRVGMRGAPEPVKRRIL